jgi:hypothetical protein
VSAKRKARHHEQRRNYVSGTSAIPRNCARKRRYTTKTAARDSVIKEKKKILEPLEPYKCKSCKGWHIGHPPGWKKWRERKRRKHGAS